MFYKGYAGIIVLFAALVLYSVFIFDHDKGELEWRQAQGEVIAESEYIDFDNWTIQNISKDEDGWTSMTNDPILIGPSMETSQAKQTYIHIELSVKGDHNVQVFWREAGQSFSETKSKVFSGKTIEFMVDGDMEQIRIDPAMESGVQFTIHAVRIAKYR